MINGMWRQLGSDAVTGNRRSSTLRDMATKPAGAKSNPSVGTRSTTSEPVSAVCDRRTEDASGPRRSQNAATTAPVVRSSALVDTRVIYCGDNLEQLKKLPDACVDLICIDPPFNSNRNY